MRFLNWINVVIVAIWLLSQAAVFALFAAPGVKNNSTVILSYFFSNLCFLSILLKWRKPASGPGPTSLARQVNQSLYKLYTSEGEVSPKMQVLFFHGFQFGQDYENAHISTWVSRDGSYIWPETWLVKEFPNAHVFFVSYNAHVHNSSSQNESFDLRVITENLIYDLMAANIGQDLHCPVILVGHGFGGLVIKQVCLEIHRQSSVSYDNVKYKTCLENLKGIFYYGTPHHGSPFMDKVTNNFLKGPLAKYVRILSTSAERLNSDFDQVRSHYSTWRIEGLGESHPTKLVGSQRMKVVPEASARDGCVHNFNLVEDADHISLTRPSNTKSRSFRNLANLLHRLEESRTGSMAGVRSDVAAVGSMVAKSVSFLPQLRNDWYAASDELADFPNKIEILRLKYHQWKELMRRYSTTEDKKLKSLAIEAVEMIDQEQKYVDEIKRGRFLISFRRKAFPGRLNSIVDRLLTIVEAGPQLLENKVASIDLLDKDSKTPNLLPYSPDKKYVPVSDCVAAVQKALQDRNGKRVVTVCGVAGIGKSSLAKYLSLLYQDKEAENLADLSTETGKLAGLSTLQSCFPDGVFYLFCGQGADVKQIQLELLRSLGCAPGPSTDSTVNVEKEMLKERLKEQKSLIILDDLWQQEVLKNLLVPGRYLKYLVTAQIRTIWGDAEMIELKAPSFQEAEMIMANYTEGLPVKGSFPDSVKGTTDAIIRRLDYHPLSLANAGLAISQNRATDPDAWKQAEESIRDDKDELEERRVSPIVFDTPYPRTLGASMMLMVNNLGADARRFLFLVTLLMGDRKEVREDLVKYILKRIEPDQSKFNYDKILKVLQDRSLVTLHTSITDDFVTLHTNGTDDFATLPTSVTDDFLDWNENTTSTSTFLAVHGLRAHFIKKKYTVELKSIMDQLGSQNGVAPTFHSPGSYTIQVRIIQTQPRARYSIVEKTVNADGTWTEPSQVDGEETLTMGSSDNSGMLRFANPQGDNFLVALGVHNNKRWCDIVVDTDSSDTCMKIHPTYDSKERGEMLLKQLVNIEKTSSKAVYIKVDYYKEDGRTYWATITISSPIFHSPKILASTYFTTHVRVIHTEPCARYSIVEKTVWYYGGGGTWTPGEVDGEHILSTGGGSSGTLRFANTQGDYFLVALGIHNNWRWWDIVVDMDSTDTGMQINPSYYAGGSRSSMASYEELTRTSSKNVNIKVGCSEDGNTSLLTITICEQQRQD